MKYLNMTQTAAIIRVVTAESHGMRPAPEDVLIQLETLRDGDRQRRRAVSGLAGAVIRRRDRKD